MRKARTEIGIDGHIFDVRENFRISYRSRQVEITNLRSTSIRQETGIGIPPEPGENGGENQGQAAWR